MSARRDEYDGKVAHSTYLGEDGETVLGVEHHVEQDQVGWAGRQKVEDLLARRGVPHLVALCLEQSDEQTSDLRIVVDHDETTRRVTVGREGLCGLKYHNQSVVTSLSLWKRLETSY